MNLAPKSQTPKLAKSCMKLMLLMINLLGRALILRIDGIMKVNRALSKNSTMSNYVTRKYSMHLLFNLFHRWVIVPGTSLMPNGLMGVVYLLALGWLFLGIAIISDIFME